MSVMLHRRCCGLRKTYQGKGQVVLVEGGLYERSGKVAENEANRSH